MFAEGRTSVGNLEGNKSVVVYEGYMGAFAYEDTVVVARGVRGKDLAVGTASGMGSSRSSDVAAADLLLVPGKAIRGEVVIAPVTGLGHSLESQKASVRGLFPDIDCSAVGSLFPRRR